MADPIYLAGYAPRSNITSQSRIDLDQSEMESHLEKQDFAAALAIYAMGGNSGAMAEITVAPLPETVAGNALVTQGGGKVGFMENTATVGSTVIKVTYMSVCKEGGLAIKDVSGCFVVGRGIISIGGVAVGVPADVVNTYRSLQGLSTKGQNNTALQRQEFYAIYRSYFDGGDYPHKRVMAMFERTGICSFCDDASRIETIKLASVCMGVWMHVICTIERAIADCQLMVSFRSGQNGCINCNDNAIRSWDAAVAFYVGSLEGIDGDGSGKLLYALAEKRCRNFGTCGVHNGRSAVNSAILEQFRLGQASLLKGQCEEVMSIKRRIVELMSIPLVQGTYYYVYNVDKLQGGSREIAKGATFAAAILPRIDACNPGAAKIISDNVNIDSPLFMAAGGFMAVRQALESVYACLGITCEDIGGLVLEGTGPQFLAGFYEWAEPCKTSAPSTAVETEESDRTAVIAFVIAVVALIVVMVGVFACYVYRARKPKNEPETTVGLSGIQTTLGNRS